MKTESFVIGNSSQACEVIDAHQTDATRPILNTACGKMNSVILNDKYLVSPGLIFARSFCQSHFPCSVVVTTRNDLFRGRLEENCVLELGSVASFDVVQWRIILNNTGLNKSRKSKEM